ncbi:fibrous sheath-interacting protein 1 [Echinops telfairi]|uniref:Fibrous sheath-interacting protein 1 n=1 Tax=Echinops telfairi TaxID=9371 RepID=A0AC55CVZ6_ECHTE|nr:fibrous sheath-interacting protein 1 [Echinops telfairi]
MDIIKGNLDRISKPASNSRTRPGSRGSNASLEVLSPEPVPFKLVTAIKLSCGREDHSESTKGSRSSADDTWEHHPETANVDDGRSDEDLDDDQYQTIPECSDDPNIQEVDCKLQDAIQKMKRLDKILVKIQCREREVKKQGLELRIKLWEELKSAKSTLQSNEEMENTNKFLTLNASPEEIVAIEPSCDEDEGNFRPVFPTQISPEEYETHANSATQGFIYDVGRNKSLVILDKKPSSSTENTELRGKPNQDFIQRNIEGDPQAWGVPGEGYTLAPAEHQQLADIDGKLQTLVASPSVVSSCPPGFESRCDQENDRNVEITPGEKVLRNTKEQRDQQNRLKEIDEKLRKMKDSVLQSTSLLSEDELKSLLDGCMLQQKPLLRLPSSESENRDLGETASEVPQLPDSVICESRNGPATPDSNKTEGEDATALEEVGCGTPRGYYLTKALASHYMADALVDEAEIMNRLPFAIGEVMSDRKDYFMSKALGIGRLKRPSFLDGPLCATHGNLLSEDQHLTLSSPVKPQTDEQETEELTEECEES